MKRGIQCYLTLILAFLLGSHNGFVALWTETAKEPAVVFPYRVSTLPPNDQAALERGIRVDSPEALHRLLEDFLS